MQKDTVVYGSAVAALYAVAYLASDYATPLAAVFYTLGLFFTICSLITIVYIFIQRPYASSPVVKGLPLLATLTLPSLLLMLAASSSTSYLPFSATLRHLRS